MPILRRYRCASRHRALLGENSPLVGAAEPYGDGESGTATEDDNRVGLQAELTTRIIGQIERFDTAMTIAAITTRTNTSPARAAMMPTTPKRAIFKSSFTRSAMTAFHSNCATIACLS